MGHRGGLQRVGAWRHLLIEPVGLSEPGARMRCAGRGGWLLGVMGVALRSSTSCQGDEHTMHMIYLDWWALVGGGSKPTLEGSFWHFLLSPPWFLEEYSTSDQLVGRERFLVWRICSRVSQMHRCREKPMTGRRDAGLRLRHKRRPTSRAPGRPPLITSHRKQSGDGGRVPRFEAEIRSSSSS